MDPRADRRDAALSLLAWPALADLSPTPGARVRFTCGVWGKVPGASSDYRWLATSPGFAADDELAKAINLGAEDRPERSWYWRRWQGRYCAICTYPSRAIDAAGRRGFCEKQVLLTEPDPALPGAAAALALLPCLRDVDDRIWWEQAPAHAWSDPQYRLPIAVPADGALTVCAADLWEVARRGLSALAASVRVTDLAKALGTLHAGLPAWLSSPAPLSAEAVATLLLPLPRSLADQASLAGWTITHRPRWEDLGRRWSLLVVPAGDASEQPGEVGLSAAQKQQGQLAAQALLAAQPALLQTPWGPPSGPSAVLGTEDARALVAPARDLPLPRPSADAPPAIRRLWAFAARIDDRWIEPAQLLPLLGEAEDATGAQRVRAALQACIQELIGWLDELREHRPAGAAPEHWQVKLDVLRVLGLAGVEDRRLGLALGLPDAAARVPALLFFPVLRPAADPATDPWAGLPQPQAAITQSLRCPDLGLRGQIKDWLRQVDQVNGCVSGSVTGADGL